MTSPKFTPAARAPFFALTIFFAALLLLLGWLTFIAALDRAQAKLVLGSFQPVISAAVRLFSFDRPDLLQLVTWYGGALALSLGLCGSIAVSQLNSRVAGIVLIALALAAAGELALLNAVVIWGVAAYGAALVLVGLAAAAQPGKAEPIAADAFLPNSRKEWWILGAIVLLAAIFRIYALDQLTNFFEGELSAYSAGATRLGGIALANKGVTGPWAPLGLLYYLPIYLSTSLLGTNLLALRISSAWVGILTVPLLYFFARGLAGRRAAQFAAMLFALDQLHIGWSRTDVHPHGVTTWPTLLLTIALLSALRSGKTVWWLGCALGMGLSWHQYPSGQSAVALPLVALVLLLFSERQLPPRRKAALIFIPLGILLWYLGLPLSYYLADRHWAWLNPFTLTTGRTSWGAAQDAGFGLQLLTVAGMVSHNFWDLVQGLFSHAPQLHLQDQLPYFTELGARTLAWPVAVCFALGLPLLVRHWRRPEAAVLIALLLVALLPGILSEKMFPKRASTFYPAAEVCAAIFLAWFVEICRSALGPPGRLLAALPYLGLVFYAGLSCNLWFSGGRWAYGFPPEETIVRELTAEIEPGTIVIVDAGTSYLGSKFTFLMIEALRAPAHRPNIWLLFKPEGQDWIRLAANPALAAQYLDTPDWSYRWTALEAQRQESRHNRAWSKAVWVLQQYEGPEAALTDERIEQVQQACPGARMHAYPAQARLPFRVTILVCDDPAVIEAAAPIEPPPA